MNLTPLFTATADNGTSAVSGGQGAYTLPSVAAITAQVNMAPASKATNLDRVVVLGIRQVDQSGILTDLYRNVTSLLNYMSSQARAQLHANVTMAQQRFYQVDNFMRRNFPVPRAILAAGGQSVVYTIEHHANPPESTLGKIERTTSNFWQQEKNSLRAGVEELTDTAKDIGGSIYGLGRLGVNIGFATGSAIDDYVIGSLSTLGFSNDFTNYFSNQTGHGIQALIDFAHEPLSHEAQDVLAPIGGQLVNGYNKILNGQQFEGTADLSGAGGQIALVIDGGAGLAGLGASALTRATNWAAAGAIDDYVVADSAQALDSGMGVRDASVANNEVTRTTGRNTATYVLDANGDTVSVRFSLREDFGGGDRSYAEVQAQSNAAARGVAGDQGGHLVAYRFMPEQGPVNLFPQNGNFNTSAFKTLENDYARYLDEGYQVDGVHTLSSPDPLTGRPGGVQVGFTVRDASGSVVDSFNQLFNNASGEVYVRRVY